MLGLGLFVRWSRGVLKCSSCRSVDRLLVLLSIVSCSWEEGGYFIYEYYWHKYTHSGIWILLAQVHILVLQKWMDGLSVVYGGIFKLVVWSRDRRTIIFLSMAGCSCYCILHRVPRRIYINTVNHWSPWLLVNDGWSVRDVYSRVGASLDWVVG